MSPQRESNPWPSRYRLEALTIELWETRVLRKVRNFFALYKQKNHGFFGVFWINIGSWYFKAPQISLAAAARDILVNFEISLAVFIQNTPRNRAISYTTKQESKITECRLVNEEGILS